MKKEYKLYLNDNQEYIDNFHTLGEAQRYGKSLNKDFYILDEVGRNVTFNFTVRTLLEILSGYEDDIEVRIGFENSNSSNLVVYDEKDGIYLNCPVDEEEFDVYRV